MNKASRVSTIICYVCAIICMVALLVCVILNFVNMDKSGNVPPASSSSSSFSGGENDNSGNNGDNSGSGDDSGNSPEETPPEGGENPGITPPSSGGDNEGDSLNPDGGSGDTGDQPQTPPQEISDTEKVLQLIVASENLYVDQFALLINSDGTLNGTYIDSEIYATQIEEKCNVIMNIVNAKFGTVSEITDDMLLDDDLSNSIDALRNCLIDIAT